MKNANYRNSKLKHELLARKRSGAREVIWKINDHQKEFIESRLGFYTEPYLYEIRTMKLSDDVKNFGAILKEIHYKNKKGKKTIISKLTFQEKKLLDKFGIQYRPYNYMINLN